jgi:hypothetical protein
MIVERTEDCATRGTGGGDEDEVVGGGGAAAFAADADADVSRDGGGRAWVSDG